MPETEVKPAYAKQQPQSIQRMFSSIAKSYDRGNSILSFSMHRLWNSTLIREISQHHPTGILLDLCAGTGDIAFGYLKKAKGPAKAVLLDFCGEMLECAKEKAQQNDLSQNQLTFIEGDAQQISLDDNSVDAATVAYGIRNVKDPLACIKEAYRVLRPGGHFGILELTRPTSSIMRAGHSLYLRKALPLMGRLFLTNEDAYSYLCNSIQDFASPEELAGMMREAGFENTMVKPMMGGVATILIGRKPEARWTTPRTAYERTTIAQGQSFHSHRITRQMQRSVLVRARRRRLANIS